jgi:hypothetical protein
LIDLHCCNCFYHKTKQNKKTFTMFTTLLSFDSSAIAANALTCVDDSIACVLGTVAVGSLLALVGVAMAVVTVNAERKRRQDAKGLVATSTTMSFSTTTTEDDNNDDECMPVSDSNEKSCRRVKKSVQFANTLVSSMEYVEKDESKAWTVLEGKENKENGYAMEDMYHHGTQRYVAGMAARKGNDRLKRLDLHPRREQEVVARETCPMRWCFPWQKDTDKGDASIYYRACWLWEERQNALEWYNHQQPEGLSWVKSKNGNGWTQLRRSTRARRKPDRLTM